MFTIIFRYLLRATRSTKISKYMFDITLPSSVIFVDLLTSQKTMELVGEQLKHPVLAL